MYYKTIATTPLIEKRILFTTLIIVIIIRNDRPKLVRKKVQIIYTK